MGACSVPSYRDDEGLLGGLWISRSKYRGMLHEYLVGCGTEQKTSLFIELNRIKLLASLLFQPRKYHGMLHGFRTNIVEYCTLGAMRKDFCG